MKSAEGWWIHRVEEALTALAQEKGGSPPEGRWPITVETPPRLELGDLAFPMFPLAKILRQAPAQIAQEVAGQLERQKPEGLAEARADGPYVNLRFSRPLYFRTITERAVSEGPLWGRSDRLAGKRIMVEFSCPNTNKPLHLGHLRNDALGEALSRILRFAGAEVLKVNLINDRGIHICKSMLAYLKEGQGQTPERAGRKSDHFVGDWYVRYAQMERDNPGLEVEAQDLLRRWEAGDPEVRSLWETMNRWAINGIEATYRRTGVSFDRVYYESQTYLRGRQDVLEGLRRGVFYRREDGAVVARLPWKENPEAPRNAEKVLLRADGTSIYLTQDIGTALQRYEDWPFDVLVYVVASEQEYHFKVLFEVLRQLGHDWASNLYHLSYGMVHLPEGRMKSREGTVVDADNLLDELARDALEEIRAKGRESELADPAETAEKVALGAVHYYLLQPSPSKDMVFNPADSLNFNGNTGPYLQYTGARLSSLFRKGGEPSSSPPDWSGLTHDHEWLLLREIDRFPAVVASAAERYDPSDVANYLYGLAQGFSRFYHECPVLTASPGVREARLQLCQATLVTLRNGLGLLNIPFLEAM